MLRWFTCFWLIILSCFSFVFANPNQVLANKKLAYYGKEFYAKKKISKHDLLKVLKQPHQFVQGDFDQLGSINQCQGKNCFQHQKIDYQQARKIIFGDLFKKTDTNGSYVQDVYCQKKIYFRTVDEIAQRANIINIEHTWPQSRFSRSYDKLLQKGDLHHLYPSDSRANSSRGNYEFGDATAETRDTEEVEKCPPSQIQDIAGHILYTPPKNHKGNVARSLFYFSIRYELSIDPAEEMILKMWHEMDPVDQEERDRNNKIATYQLSRNPFIDFPDLVDHIQDF